MEITPKKPASIEHHPPYCTCSDCAQWRLKEKWYDHPVTCVCAECLRNKFPNGLHKGKGKVQKGNK